MNPNNPKRRRIIELIQSGDEPIKNHVQLASMMGISADSALRYVEDLQFLGQLTRDQHGVFVTLTPANEPKSGVNSIPPLTAEQIAAAREASKRPKRARAPIVWLRAIIIGESEKMLEGAPPDNPELAKQIVEATTLAEQLKAQAVPRAPRPERAPKPKPLRSSRESLPELIGLAPLPMPKPVPEPARRWQDEHRAQREALEIAAEANLKRKMEQQAKREEREVPVTKFCPKCLEMPWRRPKDMLCRCGKGFEPESVEISLERQSSIALCERQ